MQSRSLPRLALFLLVTAILSCTAAGPAIIERTPGDGGFPVRNTAGGLTVDASLEPGFLGSGELAVTLRSNAAIAVLEARLYLEDGTPLGLLRTTESAAENASILHFRVPPNLRVHERMALTARNGVYTEVNLEHSLLRLQLETPSGIRAWNTGLRAGDQG